MRAHGDGAKPLLATEVTWNSSLGQAPPQFGIGVSAADQARLLSQSFALLGRNRLRLGVAGLWWYTWMGDETPGPVRYAFNYAGLLRYDGGRISSKPALTAFRLAAAGLER
jgi:hypothetical protein